MSMSRAQSCSLPKSSRQRAVLFFAGICVLAPAGAGCMLPMSRLLEQGPPAPLSLPQDEAPPLRVPFESGDPHVVQTAYAAAEPELPPPAPVPSHDVTVNLETVLRSV